MTDRRLENLVQDEGDLFSPYADFDNFCVDRELVAIPGQTFQDFGYYNGQGFTPTDTEAGAESEAEALVNRDSHWNGYGAPWDRLPWFDNNEPAYGHENLPPATVSEQPMTPPSDQLCNGNDLGLYSLPHDGESRVNWDESFNLGYVDPPTPVSQVDDFTDPASSSSPESLQHELQESLYQSPAGHLHHVPQQSRVCRKQPSPSPRQAISEVQIPMARYSRFWNAPRRWTAAHATTRGLEVFHDPTLSIDNLPPEAALIFMPARPDFPLMTNSLGHAVMSPRFPNIQLKAIPWLPFPFDITKIDGWQVSLYMVFGATVKDMAQRLPADFQPSHSATQLENRVLKKSLDYRNRHGGFGQDPRPIKGGKVSDNAKAILTGHHDKFSRPALDALQLLFGVMWEVDTDTWTMRQSKESRHAYLLPEPRELDPILRDILMRLNSRATVPTLAQMGWHRNEIDGTWWATSQAG
ncbi:hypothetical protein BT63DRAFT_479160 [Microthyrium microscopicum]|uniref:Uncharacterized protein n=1 Tax=Microthyrium microscopicum TaxID=703497 RepID=A0A6A6UAU6_9PEZI|nr:hypothetical protein BT63DRAFT_479160 [Microthyrium microscopicum]